MGRIGERIRELRKERGISQKELGEKLGVANTTVSIWERGEREPEGESKRKLREYFGVTMAYLMGEETGERERKGKASFGERLTELRREKGMTQEEVAEKLGVTKNTIHVWEKGKRLPEDEWATYNEISILFGVSYEYVAGESEEREEHWEEDGEMAAEEAERAEREKRRMIGKMYKDLSSEMEEIVDSMIRKAYAIDKRNGRLRSQEAGEGQSEE